MANLRSWLPRSEEIIGFLRQSKLKYLDREAIEHLFRLQRRAALHLMKSAGVEMCNGSHLVKRKDLIAWVVAIEAAEGPNLQRRNHMMDQVREEVAEYQALRCALADAGRPPVQFTLPSEVMSLTIQDIPSAIQITPGNISISFDKSDPLAAIELLYLLGKVIASDFEGFLAASLPPDLQK